MACSIAIVGGGPRGVWAVEELLAAARDFGSVLDITVFDPQPPGSGATYHPDSPSERILNVRSSVVRTKMYSLDSYRRNHLNELPPLDPFPPRAVVGQLLAASWENALAHCPAQCTVTHVARRVDSLAELVTFDQVIFLTGHEPSTIPDGMISPYEDLDQIAPGTTVAIRGAALTCIDVIMELTFGRGGRCEDGHYVASGKEPALIAPYSRSGRFIGVKPSPATDTETALLEPYLERIRACADVTELRALLLQAAGRVHGSPVSWEDLKPKGSPREEIEASLAHPRRAAQALGFVWRELYPAIVERVSFGGMDVRGEFFELTRTLEPWAFGPPADQLRRLLMLIDANLLTLDSLDAGPIESADVHVNAVLAPAGLIPGSCAHSAFHELVDTDPAVRSAIAEAAGLSPDEVDTLPFAVTDQAGYVPGSKRVAFAGRMTEPYVLGNDTLSRALHDVIPRWARIVARSARDAQRSLAPHGIPPIPGRIDAWIRQLEQRPELIEGAVHTHGSPVNIVNPNAMKTNCDELIDAGAMLGVDVRIFFARKANKALTFVDKARDLGHSIDVSSYNELVQVCDAGLPGERIIVSAAVKSDALIERAIAAGATISADSVAECRRIAHIATSSGTRARIAPRLAPSPEHFPPTRFGQLRDVWMRYAPEVPAALEIRGVHFHLHGYDAADRARAIEEALPLVDRLRAVGQPVEFIDMGGGVPMSYLNDAQSWTQFLDYRDAMNSGAARAFTWKGHPLSNIYSFWQTPTRGQWLNRVLAGGMAEQLRSRGLRLHLEPGRAVLDGCGVTAAEVAFIKQRSDGVPLVGLAMNRTQLRTAADDYLIDPLLVPRSAPETGDTTAFLVGAYCIEDEVIMKRAIRFPTGLAVGDILLFPNTAGYFMHIVESASHQIPLATNLVFDPQAATLTLDRIDDPHCG